ncbi:MAG: UMUC domain-containing protein DNA-repair protein [SAR86 cluster bacterium]|uniref:UMUC domain-containing protein DNA-repair protein n=1 Tax=SAR86 cluster bacterium TaxID=2030880 RepID=A0A2A5B9Q0_9GAMM|nr:MAG: UMUC domain-containing protein DNA-repair protein [SAR86 cluster bacterium]
MYALVDCNTFYASCEQIFRPDLWGKPVVVLSNNDGCIVARNKEAKALDIPDLVPYFQVKDLLSKHNVHIFSSNYELYGDISTRVMKILDGYQADVEIYSIDEAFMKLYTKIDYKAFGLDIKKTLFTNVGMPVCVGVAPTKTLAKLANRVAKKMKSQNGVCVLDTPDKWEWILKRVKTQDIWGIGRRISARLADMGIHTAYDLATHPELKYLKRKFSVVLERTVNELNGIPCIPLELEPSPKKEVICSRSFGKKIHDLKELEQAISQYAARACEKMRKQNGLTKTLWVFAETSRFLDHSYARQKVVKLPQLTNDTTVISAYAKEAIQEIYRPGVPFYKCGIGLLDLSTRKHEQLHFFTPRQSERSRTLMKMMDGLNKRYGRGTVTLANAGIEPSWSMQRNMKSPAYTTRWADIPKIRC